MEVVFGVIISCAVGRLLTGAVRLGLIKLMMPGLGTKITYLYACVWLVGGKLLLARIEFYGIVMLS